MTELNLFDDFVLIDRLHQGDEGALNLIYKKYWQKLFTSAYNILKDKAICEDIIQEIFIKLWTNRDQLEIKVSLIAYLQASTRYEVFRQIRYGSVRESIFDNLIDRLQSPSEYGSIEHKELVMQIDAIVNTLPVKCKNVYKLSREDHLSHKEIASRLNISTKTVENHLTKALRQLRVLLGDVLMLSILWLLASGIIK